MALYQQEICWLQVAKREAAKSVTELSERNLLGYWMKRGNAVCLTSRYTEGVLMQTRKRLGRTAHSGVGDQPNGLR